MKVKDLMKRLKELDGETEVVIHKWDTERGSSFISLDYGATQQDKSMLILINGLKFK